jgi:integrase
MAIKAYEKNGKQYFRVYVNLRSKRDGAIREQIYDQDIETLQAAEAREKKMLREASEKIHEREFKGTCFGTLVDRWEDWKASLPQDDDEAIEWDTLRDMIQVLRKYTQPWFNRPANEITRADAKEVIRFAKSQGRSNSFLSGKLKCSVNAVFNWGIDQRIILGASGSPMEGIKISKVEDKLPEIYTLPQIKRLLSLAKSLDHSWYPIWAVALLTGMRAGELHALNWTEVDFENKLLRVHQSFNPKKGIKCTKAGYWRTVPMSDELIELLKQLKINSESQGRPQVLPRLRDWNHGEQARILKTFCLSVGLPPIKFHTLRACFATQLLQNQIAPATVMKICGWKDLKTMQRYIRLSGIDEAGATDVLQFGTNDKPDDPHTPNDQLLSGADAVRQVVSLFEFKAKTA